MSFIKDHIKGPYEHKHIVRQQFNWADSLFYLQFRSLASCIRKLPLPMISPNSESSEISSSSIAHSLVIGQTLKPCPVYFYGVIDIARVTGAQTTHNHKNFSACVRRQMLQDIERQLQ